MTGFAVYNNAGALTVNSDYKSPTYIGTPKAIGLIDMGSAAGLTSVFGDFQPLGYISPADSPQPGRLYWFKIPAGKWAFPGAWMFPTGCTKMETENTAARASGYLDVLATDGKTVIWSAVAAGKMPRVLGYINIVANTDIENKAVTYTVPANVYFCLNSMPGNLSDDGQTVGYNGLIMKQISATQVQIAWITKYQRNWASTLKSVGLRIPYCVFPGV